MCGIAGLVGFTDRGLLERMLSSLAHRGPDDSSSFYHPPFCLGYRRLAVIDLKTGDQPFFNEAKTLCLFYNGEIYNFRKLRAILKSLGHTFKTRSDGEVIVHGFEEWGEAVFSQLNGMFALALYDLEERRLFLVRDHFGIKPLYYYFDSARQRLLFASEIKPLLLYSFLTPRPNGRLVYEYLSQRLHDHDAETFFTGVLKLLPGELLRVELGSGGRLHLKKRKFWYLSWKSTPNRNVSERELVERFRFLLEDSLRLRLLSDVPLGVCLSGGLDSATISLLIQHLTGSRQKTFSAVFPGEANDESAYIEAVNRRTGAESFLVYPRSDDFFAELEDLVLLQEEPFISSGPYAQYCVMREASREVKVLLDGQGGDELLAGYDPYFFVYLRELLREGRLTRLAGESFALHGLLLKFLRMRLAFKGQLGMMSLLRPEFYRTYRSYRSYKTTNNLKQRLFADVFRYSLPALLRYEDKNSSAFSLESRVPFLDPRLVEFIFSLPEDLLIRRGLNKYILRCSLQDLLPAKIYKRRWKVGFTTPEEAWFRREKKHLLAIFQSNRFRERPYWRQDRVLEAFSAFLRLKNSDSMLFWRLLNLEIWLRVFVD